MKHIYTSVWILKVVQWLRIGLPVCETWVRYLLGELRSHMPQGKISYNYCVFIVVLGLSEQIQ